MVIALAEKEPRTKLPENCIYFDGKSRYLIEIPPGIKPFPHGRTISWVAMPWQYVCIGVDKYKPWGVKEEASYHVTSLQLLWSYTKLTSSDDLVRVARLPNISGGGLSDGLVCLGNTRRSGSTPSAAINQAIENFFASRFNGDYGWPIPYGKVERWVHESENNPECWKTWKMSKRYFHPLTYFINIPSIKFKER